MLKGILYMIGARVLKRENKSAGLADYLSISDARLNPVVQDLTRISDPKLLSFKVPQLISSVVYPTLTPGTVGHRGLSLVSQFTECPGLGEMSIDNHYYL